MEGRRKEGSQEDLGRKVRDKPMESTEGKESTWERRVEECGRKYAGGTSKGFRKESVEQTYGKYKECKDV